MNCRSGIYIKIFPEGLEIAPATMRVVSFYDLVECTV